jgi:tetratricopeptide (TPR) repeat protein
MNIHRTSLVVGICAVLLAGCTQTPQVAGKPGQTPTVNVAASGAAFPQIKDRRPAPKSSLSVDQVETNAANGGSKRDLGLVYYSTGGFAAAQKELDEAVVQKDSDGLAWLYLGYAAMGNGDVDRAVEALKRAGDATDLTPVQRAAALAELGTVHYQGLNEDVQAKEAFTKAVELNPKEGTAAIALGTMLAEKKDSAGAKRCFILAASGLKKGADRASVYACIGRLEEESGDKVAARAQYALAIKDDPDNAWAKTRLAQLK